MEKKVRKIGRFFLLALVKETYLLGRNILGLVEHPYKTILRIARERDFSQVFLLFGVFGGSWLVFCLLLVLRLFLGGLGFGDFFLFIWGGILCLGTVYLSYWLLFFIRTKRSSEKIFP